jgi:hypothetical protein
MEEAQKEKEYNQKDQSLSQNRVKPRLSPNRFPYETTLRPLNLAVADQPPCCNCPIESLLD